MSTELYKMWGTSLPDFGIGIAMNRIAVTVLKCQWFLLAILVITVNVFFKNFLIRICLPRIVLREPHVSKKKNRLATKGSEIFTVPHLKFQRNYRVSWALDFGWHPKRWKNSCQREYCGHNGKSHPYVRQNIS